MEPDAIQIAGAVNRAASHNDLLLQMDAVLGAGLATSFRISSRSYDVFVPLHRETFEASRDQRPADARSGRKRLLAGTLEVLEHELHDRTAAQDAAVTPPAVAVASRRPVVS